MPDVPDLGSSLWTCRIPFHAANASNKAFAVPEERAEAAPAAAPRPCVSGEEPAR